MFVVPGTYYELRRNKTLFPVEESAFLQISRILLSGAVLTAVSSVLLFLVYQVSPGSLLNAADLLRSGVDYVASHVGLVGKTLVCQLAASALLSAIASDTLTKANAGHIRRGTALYGVTEIEKEPTEVTFLSVKLTSGVELLGYHYGITTDSDPAKQELVLQRPLYVVHPGSSELQPFDGSWRRIVIIGSQIQYVTVKYVESATVPVTEKPSHGKIVSMATRCWSAMVALWERRWPRIGVQLALLGVVLTLSALR